METNREVAEDLTTLSRVTAPEVRAALAASLAADAAELAAYLEAVREVRWAPVSDARVADLPRSVDLLLDDFEGSDYSGWTPAGTAFGSAPRRRADIAPAQGDMAPRGDGLVATYDTRDGEDGVAAHAHTGTLTSDPFVLSRDHVHFLVSGGDHDGTRVELIARGDVVRKTSGQNDNRLSHARWDVHEAVFSLLMMRHGFIAPSVNIENLDPAAKGFQVVTAVRNAKLNVVMSNSFGFGGTNATLVFRAVS
jgi:hypothetical protein